MGNGYVKLSRQREPVFSCTTTFELRRALKRTAWFAKEGTRKGGKEGGKVLGASLNVFQREYMHVKYVPEIASSWSLPKSSRKLSYGSQQTVSLARSFPSLVPRFGDRTKIVRICKPRDSISIIFSPWIFLLKE